MKCMSFRSSGAGTNYAGLLRRRLLLLVLLTTTYYYLLLLLTRPRRPPAPRPRGPTKRGQIFLSLRDFRENKFLAPKRALFLAIFCSDLISRSFVKTKPAKLMFLRGQN